MKNVTESEKIPKIRDIRGIVEFSNSIRCLSIYFKEARDEKLDEVVNIFLG